MSTLSQIETVMTYVSFIGHGFLNSLFSNPIQSGRAGIKLPMPLIGLMEELDATMQPRFDRSVFQNLFFNGLRRTARQVGDSFGTDSSGEPSIR